MESRLEGCPRSTALGAATVLLLASLAACSTQRQGDAEAGQQSDVAPLTAIVDVTVIDAVHGVRPHHTVVFQGDEIVTVQPVGTARLGGATVLDGAGKYLVPGLWDLHVHLTYEPELTAAMPALFLSYGVTSVRDTGGMLARLLPVVEAMKSPGAHAPRVFYSGPLLDGQLVVYDGVQRPQLGIANPSPEAARSNVARLAAAGVDFVKLYELLSPEVFEALVEEARNRELPIAAHVPLSMLAGEAGARVDSMEHLRNLELACAADAPARLARRRQLMEAHGGPGAQLRGELHALQRGPAMEKFDADRCAQTLALLAESHTLQVPTLRLNTLNLYPPFARSDWQQAVDLLPASVRQTWQTLAVDLGDSLPADPTFGQFSLDLTRRLHAAGVPLGAGTDTPIGLALPGYSLHTELQRLYEAGLTPLEVLGSATIRAAEFFGLQEELGAVAPGHGADLLLLDADPLLEVANLRRISHVVWRGRVATPAELAALARGEALR